MMNVNIAGVEEIYISNDDRRHFLLIGYNIVVFHKSIEIVFCSDSLRMNNENRRISKMLC